MNECCTLEGDPLLSVATTQYLYPHHENKNRGAPPTTTDRYPRKWTTTIAFVRGWHHNFASLLCNRRIRTRNPSDKGFDFPDDRIYCEHMYRPPPPLACMMLLLLRSMTCPRVLAAKPHPPTDLLYWQRHEQDECKRGVL